MLILFEFVKTQAGAEELHKTTMPFGGSFCQENLVIKIYILSDKASQFPITLSFAFFERRFSIQRSFLYFSSISKEKKSLKCDNVIIKIGCFCLSSIVPVFTPLTTKISNLRTMHIAVHPTTLLKY